jgi:hypothetical protein
MDYGGEADDPRKRGAMSDSTDGAPASDELEVSIHDSLEAHIYWLVMKREYIHLAYPFHTEGERISIGLTVTLSS